MVGKFGLPLEMRVYCICIEILPCNRPPGNPTNRGSLHAKSVALSLQEASDLTSSFWLDFRWVEDPLVLFSCFLLFGQVVVSFHTFPISILNFKSEIKSGTIKLPKTDSNNYYQWDNSPHKTSWHRN